MADLQFTVTALDKATSAFLKMAEQVDKLSAKIDKLDGKKATVRAELAAGKAEAGLDALGRKVDSLDGRTAKVKVDVDKSISASLIQLNALGRALSSLALPAVAASVAPQLASIGAAAMSLSGALGVLPAAGFAAAGVIGTLTVAFNDFGAALYQGDSAKKIKEANAALAAMGPQARATAMAIRDLKTPFEDLRRVVQERFFAGMADEVQALTRAYLPVLRTQLAGIADELNVSARGFTTWATSAQTVRDTNTLFQATRAALHELRPAVTNVAAGLLDVGVVGSRFLPALAAHTTDLTARFRAWIAEARESGQLALWIQTGIVKMQQLGQIVVNTGGILKSVFDASTAAGADFLGTVERITGGIRDFLRSTEGQSALISFFSEIRATIDALEPGVKAVGSAIAYVVAQLAQAGVMRGAAEAFSALAVSVAPLLRDLGDLAAVVLPPVLSLLTALAPVLGPIAAGFIAISMASKGMAAVQGLIAGLSVKLAESALNAGVFTEKITGSANAGERLASVGGRLATGLSFVGAALPVIAVAAAGVAIAYDQMRDKSEELATQVVKGQVEMSAAVREQNARIQEQSMAMDMLQGEGYATGQAIGELTGQIDVNAEAAARNAAEQEKFRAEVERQLSALPPLEQAQARVKIAQDAYNEAVRQFTNDSPQARDAAANLALAKNNLKIASEDAARAEKTLADQIVETTQAAAAAANADVAYQQGLLTLASAQERAAETAKTHAAESRELQQANIQVMQANLQVADAARRKAEADAAAAGVTDTSRVGAQAYKEELIRLAGQATGPTREALLAMANGTNVAGQAAVTADIQARAYKDQLGMLAAQANGPLAAALRGAQANFGTLGGAHATAEQRAAAQKAELLRLAQMASGPVRTELTNMANQIRALPDKTVKITAQGGYTIDPIGGVSGPGTYTGGILGVRNGRVTSVQRYSRGGVMPGYTPGRDVHRFQSATGGTLDLSGGEAVMRPEWTQAVTPGYVHAANKAARRGGVEGVRKFMAVNPPGHTEADRGFASGGIIPHQRFAGGGLFMTGTPFPRIPIETYNQMVPRMMRTMAPRLVAEIKKRQAAATAAMGGGTVAGNVGSMMAALRGRFPGLALISGFRPGAITATGNRSYHGMGRAVDIPPRMDVFNWIKANYGARTKELIFSPAGGGQVWNGRNHMYTGITRANHWDHVHWAMRNGGIVPRLYDQGGVLPPGATLAINNTGRDETVVPSAPVRGDGGALIAELRRVNAQLHMLRGDVDHHSIQGTIAGQLAGLRGDLARIGSGSVAAQAQAGRTIGDLGPF